MTEATISGVERAVLGLVMVEVSRAGAKFGPQDDFTDPEWLAVLSEEVGEAAKALNERRLGTIAASIADASLCEEVIQVAAVAIRWCAAMAKGGAR